ncbi:MAG: DUF47 domain-containing protein [Candidatus Limnocylindria bacterium]
MPELRLIPQNPRFFDLFRRSAELNVEAARLLAELLDGREDVQRAARRLKDVEHAADESTHEIFTALHVSFVTPLDREDISELASALDDVVDWIEEASRRMPLYRFSQGTPLAKRFARVIVDQSEQILAGIPHLRSSKGAQALETVTREIHRLENEADELFAEGLAHMYDGVEDIPGLIEAMRWGDLYHVLETATDRAEHVAVVMHNVALKHG